MACAKALGPDELRNIEEAVMARASAVGRSREGLREDWGVYPEGHGSHRLT